MSRDNDGEKKPDCGQLLRLLESSDLQISEEAASLLKQHLANGDCLCAMIDHYMSSKSCRSLEILASVREPLDKAFLDKLSETLKGFPTPTLSLLCQVIMRTPSWLPKLPHHSFFSVLIKFLKQAQNCLHLVSGLFLLACLLPQSPVLAQNLLHDLFLVFFKTSEFYSKFLKSTDENTDRAVQAEHLRQALDAYFQRLYGIYPCNFLTFLRQQFANDNYVLERRCLFKSVIRPLLEQVKIHPMLLLATRDAELARERWMRRESHDVLAECSNLAISSKDPYPFSFSGMATPVPEEDQRSISVGSGPRVWRHTASDQDLASAPHSPLKQTQSLRDAVPVKYQSICLPRAPVDKLRPHKEHLDDDYGGNGCFWSPSMMMGLSTPPESRGTTPTSAILSRRQSWKQSSLSSSDSAQRRPMGELLPSRRSFGQSVSRLFRQPEKEKTSSSVPPSPMKPMVQADEERNRFSFGSADTKTVPEEEVGEAHSRQNSQLSQAEVGEEATESPPKEDKDKLTLDCLEKVASRLVSEDGDKGTAEDLEVAGILPESSDHVTRIAIDSPPTQPVEEQPKSPRKTSTSSRKLLEVAPAELQPRLMTSGSVRDFFQKINRIRFQSECGASTPGQGSDDEDGSGSAGNESDISGEGDILEPRLRKRSLSCPHGVRRPSKIKLKEVNEVSNRARRKRSRTRESEGSTSRKTSSVESSTRNFGATRDTMTYTQWLLAMSQQYPYLPLLPSALPFQANQNLPKLVEHEADSGMASGQTPKEGQMILDGYLEASKQAQAALIPLGPRAADSWPDEVVPRPQTPDKAGQKNREQLELEALRTQLFLMEQKCLYERFRRQQFEERSRRLFSRLKQEAMLEQKVSAQDMQLQSQEQEIERLVAALTDYRRANVENRQAYSMKEYGFQQQLQEELNAIQRKQQEIAQVNGEMDNLQKEVEGLRKDLGANKQRLMKCEAELEEKNGQPEETHKLKETIHQLENRLVMAGQLQKDTAWVYQTLATTENQRSALESRLALEMDNSQREIGNLKRVLRKEKNRTESARHQALDLETQLHQKFQEIGDVKEQMEQLRQTQQERLTAASLKYRSLLAVCGRQEVHIADLYRKIEELHTHSPKEGSWCPKEGSGLLIPSRSGPREIQSYGSWSAHQGGSGGSDLYYMPVLGKDPGGDVARQQKELEDSISE